MTVKKDYNVEGQMIPGEEIEFEAEREGWNTYILHRWNHDEDESHRNQRCPS